MGWLDDSPLDMARIPLLTREEAERLWEFHRSPAHRSLINRLFGSLLTAYDRIDALEDEVAALLALEHNATEYLLGEEYR